MKPYIEHFEFLLVMSVHPGFSGQAFIPEVLTTSRLSELIRDDQHIQMDGDQLETAVPAETRLRCAGGRFRHLQEVRLRGFHRPYPRPIVPAKG